MIGQIREHRCEHHPAVPRCRTDRLPFRTRTRSRFRTVDYRRDREEVVGHSLGTSGGLHVGPHRGHMRAVFNQRDQRSLGGPNAARERSGNDWRPRNPGPPLVGDTGIEPVTPTVSTFSARRWLRWLPTAPTNLLTSMRLLRWLSGADFDSGVARALHAPSLTKIISTKPRPGCAVQLDDSRQARTDDTLRRRYAVVPAFLMDAATREASRMSTDCAYTHTAPGRDLVKRARAVALTHVSCRGPPRRSVRIHRSSEGGSGPNDNSTRLTGP
jgi:hypothetical protein